MIRKIRRIFSIHTFISSSKSVGILLIACTVISLFLSNWSFTQSVYTNFWLKEYDFLHHIHLPHSILHIINDVLMAIFFYLVGMEIKRETLVGELSSKEKIILPAVAGLSGAVIPAILFLLVNKGTAYSHGWAIPTATDIAFSLGVLSLLGKKVPNSLRIFLTALAIIDDLIAIIVIALFYGGAIGWWWFVGILLIVGITILFNKSRLQKNLFIRIVLGMLLWFFTFKSGIHATIAGVIFAFLTPMKSIPVYEEKLHHFVNFLIVPVFALANTSIIFPDNMLAGLTSTLSIGIIIGLFVGKPLGIVLSTYLLVKNKLAKMPKGVSIMQMLGVGVIAGIGFTMSIFVSTLAFKDVAVQDVAKIAVMLASLLCMLVGISWFYLFGKKTKKA